MTEEYLYLHVKPAKAAIFIDELELPGRATPESVDMLYKPRTPKGYFISAKQRLAQLPRQEVEKRMNNLK